MPITDESRNEFWTELFACLGSDTFALGDNGQEFFVYCFQKESVSRVPSVWDEAKVNAYYTGNIFLAMA